MFILRKTCVYIGGITRYMRDATGMYAQIIHGLLFKCVSDLIGVVCTLV